MQKIYLTLVISLAISMAYASGSSFSTNYPYDSTKKKSIRKHYSTDHTFNLDLGINNYHRSGKFPDEENAIHSVRPWGSWYFGITSLLRTHVAGGFFTEWGGGISWYNFKFQNDNTRLREGAEALEFYETAQSNYKYEKSKLTASYINMYLVPVYQFGKNKYEPDRKVWEGKGYKELGFRVGLGGYVGYRIGSHTKVKYEDENGSTQKSKDHDNFYLQNLRYGVRLQAGCRGTDIFINYDLNNLFSENRGPELSAVSFGFMF